MYVYDNQCKTLHVYRRVCKKKNFFLSQSNSFYIQVYILFNMKKNHHLRVYLFPFLFFIQFLLHGKLYLLKLTKSKTSWFFFFIAHIENKYKSAYVCIPSPSK